MSASPMIESPEWYQFRLPFLFVGYFECDHCHRPIMTYCQFESEDEWRDHLFDIRCACNWGHSSYPGSKTTHRFVVEWKPKVRSLEQRAS
jgi:hypothetical protein